MGEPGQAVWLARRQSWDRKQGRLGRAWPWASEWDSDTKKHLPRKKTVLAVCPADGSRGDVAVRALHGHSWSDEGVVPAERGAQRRLGKRQQPEAGEWRTEVWKCRVTARFKV